MSVIVRPRLNMMLNLLEVDKVGNKHVVAKGKLFASYFKNQSLGVRIYPDEVGVPIFLEVWRDVVVVYSTPIEITGSSVDSWVEKLESYYFTAFGFAVINGLTFYTNVSWIRGTPVPVFQAAHTTELQIVAEGHEMAKELLLHLTEEDWNDNFLPAEIAAQTVEFLKNQTAR